MQKKLMKYYNVVVAVPACENNTTMISDKYFVLCCKAHFVKSLNYSIAQPKDDKFFKTKLSELKNIKFIHIHSPFYIGKYALKYAKQNKIPVFTTFHSQYKMDFYKSSKSHFITWCLLKSIMWVFNQSDMIFTMNQKCKEKLFEYGCTNKNIKILSNGLEKISNVPDKKVHEIIKKYNIESNKPKLLFIGRLVKQKNVDFVVDVLEELKFCKNFDFQMIFVGDSPYRKKLMHKVEKKGLEHDVVFTGKIMDKQEILAFSKIADLFVFPSRMIASH